MPYLAFLFICLCWGTSFILMDRAGLAFGPAAIGAGRLACGAVVLAIYCALKRQWIKPTLREWGHVAVVALLANAWPYTVQPMVMRQFGEHGFLGLAVTFVPLSTIVASALMLGVKPTPRQLIGVLGGLVCAGLITLDGTRRGYSVGMLLLLLSTPVAYAVGNTYLKWKLPHMPPAPIAVMFLTLGSAMVLSIEFVPGLARALDLAGPEQPHDWPMAVASLATLGATSTGLAVLAFVHLVYTQGPLFAGMATYVVPMIALVWGQWDHERLTSLQLAAIAGVLAMVGLVQWNAAEPPPEEEEPLAEPHMG